jgi:hypothetical protein
MPGSSSDTGYGPRDAILNASWRAERVRNTEDTLAWSTAMEIYDLENP